MRCFALIPAAGIGARSGAAIPKQYVPVADVPMIVRTLAAFAEVAAIERIVVVIAEADARFADLVRESDRITVVRAGGATRDATVANGLAAMRDLMEDDDWVLVHDAARCGITPQMIASLIDRLQDDPVGGLLALPLDDTVKRAATGTSDPHPIVAETVERRGLWRAQTPQMFRYRLLVDAIADAHARGIATTDESSAIESAGHRALLVPGSARNFKVTTADDLAMMDRLLRTDPPPDTTSR
jgi:2-C-methyl-D-erythritol 4-phosphate cytidylyltransferase